MKYKPAIVILGGMGPDASAYLYKLLIKKSIKSFNARNNDDFPEIHLYSVPVPDFISNNRARSIALEMLKQRVKFINKSRASYISIACNTAHVLLPELQKVSTIPFVSMIDETARQVYKDNKIKVGLMGTPSTIKYGLYQKALIKYGISVLVPSKKQIAIMEKAIRNILKGNKESEDRKNLTKVADDLINQGAEGIILGCTELPLLFPKSYPLPVYNCVEILATTLLKKYYAIGK
jgi:aspartate racemase